MTRQEWRILGRLATTLHHRFPRAWESLRYQTQFGPQWDYFPYYPAAVALQNEAVELVYALSPAERNTPCSEWERRPRAIAITPKEAIFDRYGRVVLDVLIQRARMAGARASDWS